jgi:hypothetical protein
MASAHDRNAAAPVDIDALSRHLAVAFVLIAAGIVTGIVDPVGETGRPKALRQQVILGRG